MAIVSIEQTVFVTGLVMGTASTLLIKATYDHGAVDPMTGAQVPYEKPIFLTFVMFLGMFFALPLYMWLERKNAANQQVKETDGSNAEKRSLLGADSPSYGMDSETALGDELAVDTDGKPQEPFNIWSFKLLAVLMIPSLFDMLGTILSTIGLLYVSVSLYQLSRCCVIIVTAVFKRVILKHKLTTANYLGVFINTMAMVLVGTAAIWLEPPNETAVHVSQMAADSSARTTTGLLFIFAGCVVQGAQYVFEEKVMSFDNVPPLVLIGFEGINGCILCILFAFPFAMLKSGPDNGCYEDIIGAFTLPFYSPGLMGLLIAYLLIIFLYNVFAVYITFLLSSIYHCVMDGLRPAAVWLTSLASYYILGWSGQPWSTLSWFELASMLLMFYGTAVYGGSAKVPCVSNGEFDGKEDERAIMEQQINAIPIRDTPVFSARVNHNAPIDASAATAAELTGLMTQSPALRARQAPTHAHQAQHGHLPLAQQQKQPHHPSSRANQRDIEQAMM